MAFSFSDKNFTVVGNLCFVHIDVKKDRYDIPPAIADRMLIKELVYPYISYNNGNINNLDTGVAFISSSGISFIGNYNNGYLNCYFPIDSNK